MKNLYRNALLGVAMAGLCFSQKAAAQTDEAQNIVKFNLVSPVLKSIAFQYERPLNRRISVALNMRFAPKSSLPFKDKIKDIVDDEEFTKQIDGLRTGNFAITPEVRFYLGHGYGRGFYLAPFGRYATYSAELPFKYDENGTEKVLPLSGRLNTFTGGLMLGSQFKLSQLIYLDWWILGASAGSSSGKVIGTAQLNENEQQALREELDNLDSDIIKTKSYVDANGARVDINGPWYEVRFGLAIGVRF